MLLLLTLGVLVFGKNLPDIGRSVGQVIAEFRNGMRGVGDMLGGTGSHNLRSSPSYLETLERPRRVAPTVPKFVDEVGPADPPA